MSAIHCHCHQPLSLFQSGISRCFLEGASADDYGGDLGVSRCCPWLWCRLEVPRSSVDHPDTTSYVSESKFLQRSPKDLTESEESCFDMMPAHVVLLYYWCNRRRWMGMQRQLYTFFVRVEIKERENLREGYNPSGRTCGDLSGLDGLYARKIRCAQEMLFSLRKRAATPTLLCFGGASEASLSQAEALASHIGLQLQGSLRGWSEPATLRSCRWHVSYAPPKALDLESMNRGQ